MKHKNSRTKLRKLIFLAIEIVVLVICLWVINESYIHLILPDKTAASTFTKINCSIEDKILHTRGHWVPRYRADFLVNYEVEGVQYRQWVSSNGLNRSFVDQASQENKLKQFEVGQTYTCWYDPSNPERVILSFRENWTGLFFLFLPFIIALSLIYFIFRHLLKLMGIHPHKKHKK